MSDIKLFQTSGNALTELQGSSAPLERQLQDKFEANLETLLGVRFLASEFKTTHGGRMDTLGIDENGYPVIIEYKRDKSENIINQGLFYLDWLMDHQGEFELLVRDKLGRKVADTIEWSAPRLICIASDFNKYDEHAIKQMRRNIELIRYKKFGDDLLMLELLTSVSTGSSPATARAPEGPRNTKTVTERLHAASGALAALYVDIETFILDLGDDATKKTLQHYFAFKRIKNFACVEVFSQRNAIKLYLRVDPTTIELEEGFTRNVKGIGHFGTGDLEVTVTDAADFEGAKALVRIAYEAG